MVLPATINPSKDILMEVNYGDAVILPKDGERNIMITSALPYCNNVPHLGNIIGSTLSADVFARYNRTRNRRTLYVCGTDEYGTATETQALKEGVTPQQLCDKYYELHRETYTWFDIGFDHFGRTSTPHQTQICQEVYLNLKDHNLLEKQTKEQTYCESCNKFLADRFVEGTCPNCGYDDARGDQCDGCSRTLDPTELINPRCLINRSHKVTTRATSHMFVKLDTIQPRFEEWIKKSWKEGKWNPNAVMNGEGEIIDARVRGGLRPSPLTRDLTWGVPVPVRAGEPSDGMEKKVLYVWVQFDAPFGYPSITAAYTPEWKQWWFNHQNVRLYQFMGKDNVSPPSEYLQYESGKFSKSRNVGVFGPGARETGIPPSVWRYYLLSTRPETSDSIFSWNDFITANNSVLLNNFGNFVNRVVKFIQAKFDSVLPDAGDAVGPYPVVDPQDPDHLDPTFVSEVNQLLAEYMEAMESVKLRLGLQVVMQVSNRGNQYLQRSGLGNALLASNPKGCAQVLSRAVNLIYALSALIHPFMPGTSREILEQINAPARTLPLALSNDILAEHKLGSPAYLFTKIDEKKAEEWRTRFGGDNANTAAATDADVKAAKKKAAMAAKKVPTEQVDEGLKSARVLDLEREVKEQGELVRKLKEAMKGPDTETRPSKEDLDIAVAELLRLKSSLLEELRRLKSRLLEAQGPAVVAA
ncbi:hypothetical protein FRB98_004904 [Tulasnella sp. 332]|nr:hypothetical protein FRB98_004904 [Tulasnella sp. 332]